MTITTNDTGAHTQSETPVVDSAAGQTDPAGSAAGQTDAADAEVPEVPGTGESDTTDQDDDSSTDDDGQDDAPGGRRNREAQYRRRAQAAEGVAFALRAQLDAVHQDIVTEVASSAGLRDPALLGAAGYELAGFIAEDGTVDRAKVVEATQAAMARFGIPRTGLTANPQQGAHGGHIASKGLSDVVNGALGR